jgi:hypothetical protein
MTSRRDLLTALVALAAAPSLAHAADTAIDGLNPVAVRRIGQAWRAQNPGVGARDLARRLFPTGRGPDALPRLRTQAATDFRRGAVFAYRGWRLSDTEGALFALLWLETTPTPR